MNKTMLVAFVSALVGVTAGMLVHATRLRPTRRSTPIATWKGSTPGSTASSRRSRAAPRSEAPAGTTSGRWTTSSASRTSFMTAAGTGRSQRLSVRGGAEGGPTGNVRAASSSSAPHCGVGGDRALRGRVGGRPTSCQGRGAGVSRPTGEVTPTMRARRWVVFSIGFACALACGTGAPGRGRAPGDGGSVPDVDATIDRDAPRSDAGDAFAGGDAAANTDAPTDLGPFPLGATLGATAMHLRVRADAATRVEANLYAAATGVDEALRVVMTRAAGGNPWAADMPYATLAAAGLSAAPYLYGYRAWGPNWRYDPTWTKGSSAGFVTDVDARRPLRSEQAALRSLRARDVPRSAGAGSQSSSTPYRRGDEPRDRRRASRAQGDRVAARHDQHRRGAGAPLKDDVIYEVHVRGLTRTTRACPPRAGNVRRRGGEGRRARRARGSRRSSCSRSTRPRTTRTTPTRGERQLLGLLDARVLRARPPLRVRQDAGRPDARVQGDGRGVPRAGDQGLPRRRLQPHRRGRASSGSNAASRSSSRSAGSTTPAYYELAAEHADARRRHRDGRQLQHGQRASCATRRSTRSRTGRARWASTASASTSPPCSATRARAICFTFAPGDPDGILRAPSAALPGHGRSSPSRGASATGPTSSATFPPAGRSGTASFATASACAQNELGVTPRSRRARSSARVTGSPDIFECERRARLGRRSTTSTATTASRCSDEYAYDAPQDSQAYPLGPVAGGSTSDYPWDQGGGAPAQAAGGSNGARRSSWCRRACR